jgi:hypothetical protein
MTNFQRHLFNEILDVSWELNVGDYNEIVLRALQQRINHLEEQLEEDMGVEEWRNFKEQGKRMFAPA